jgi:Helix-turn-helix domain
MDEKNKATSPERKAALQNVLVHFPGNSAKLQRTRILEALKLGLLTTFEAMRYLDIYHPPVRVKELRTEGWDIATHWKTITTEAGEEHRVGCYMLMCEVPHVQY